MTQENSVRLLSKYRRELMGFAALWIFLFHEWEPVLRGIPALGMAENFCTSIGYCGVDIFFLLSGMGLCHSIEKHSLAEFYRRRFSRLLVPYLVTGLITGLILGWTVPVLLKNLTGYTFWTADVYGYGWFFHAIVTLYLLFPGYYALFRRASGKFRFTALALLAWFLITLALNGTLRPDLYVFVNRIPVFLTGIWVGWLVKERDVSLSGPAWWLCCLGCAGGFALIFLVRYRGLSLPVPDSATPNFLIAVFGCLLLAKVFSRTDAVFPSLGRILRNILCFYGDISLEFYFLQEIGARMSRRALNECLGLFFSNLLVFAAMTILAWGLCRGCRLLKDRRK